MSEIKEEQIEKTSEDLKKSKDPEKRKHEKDSSGKEKKKKHKDKKKKKDKKSKKEHKKSKKKDEDREGHRKKSKDRHRSRSPSSKRHRSSKSSSDPVPAKLNRDKFQVDKKKLLEIAKSNLSTFLQVQNELQLASSTTNYNSSNIIIGKDKGQSIKDLINFCQKLSEGELKPSSSQTTYSSSIIIDKNEDLNKTSPSYLNNQLVPVSKPETSTAVVSLFPVSSGTKHRQVQVEEPAKKTCYVFDLDTVKLENENVLVEGKFTGQTDIRLLRPEELEGEYKAWTRKDLLINATPITGGIGKKLLEKMGWKEGEGLGKYREGSLEPLKLDIKINRKGLVSNSETGKMQNFVDPSTMQVCPNKHPVSLLLEYCKMKKWPDPLYEVIDENGPSHQRNFLIKVTVNGVPYLPDKPGSNKKQAKSNAATICLKSFGFKMLD